MAEYNKPSIGLMILSVLIPIVGLVLFFVKKADEPDAAKAYLGACIGGAIIGFIIGMGMGA